VLPEHLAELGIADVQKRDEISERDSVFEMGWLTLLDDPSDRWGEHGFEGGERRLRSARLVRQAVKVADGCCPFWSRLPLSSSSKIEDRKQTVARAARCEASKMKLRHEW
jgi:hypothetical protein